MKKLKLIPLDNIDHIVSPDDFENITLDSPATKIFTDFKRFKPLMIEENTKAVDALSLMMTAHINFNIVMSENNDFVGIISRLDISEQRIMHEISLGASRNEILVGDLMIPRSKVMTFDLSELKRATVDDVINALKQNGLRHCLVMDANNHHIRGIISSNEIARKLRSPIDISSSLTFAKIVNAVNA